MITLELLTEYTHQVLKYKDYIRPLNFSHQNGLIWINFGIMGETVKAESYYNWLKEKRNTKIEEIFIYL